MDGKWKKPVAYNKLSPATRTRRSSTTTPSPPRRPTRGGRRGAAPARSRRPEDYVGSRMYGVDAIDGGKLRMYDMGEGGGTKRQNGCAVS